MRRIVLFIACGLLFLPGCLHTADRDVESSEPTFGYVPLDPLPVTLSGDGSNDQVSIRRQLPNETMRMSIGTVTQSAGISFGPSRIGIAGNDYVVIIDYMQYYTLSIPVAQATEKNSLGENITVFKVAAESQTPNFLTPLYVGSGIRLMANVRVEKGEVNIADLFSVGVAANSENVTGSLVFMNLGLSSPKISGAIPIPTELNTATIQNAILSFGAIKALASESETILTPQVLGYFNNTSQAAGMLNGVISDILNTPPVLEVPKYTPG